MLIRRLHCVHYKEGVRKCNMGDRPLPFPESLCHRCAAPPKYVEAKGAIFILCPLLPEKYPRQPVLSCPLFKERDVPAPRGEKPSGRSR
jgi:hypothetical protein